MATSVTSVTLIPSAVQSLLHGAAMRNMLSDAAERIADRARQNARGISLELPDAIVHEIGRDGEGWFADIGYDKTERGWVLFFHEVGTVDFAPTPHLRPAMPAGKV